MHHYFANFLARQKSWTCQWYYCRQSCDIFLSNEKCYCFYLMKKCYCWNPNKEQKVVKMSEIYALEETYNTVIIYHKRTKITQQKVYRNYQIRVSKRNNVYDHFFFGSYESYRQKKINSPILLFGFCSVQEICLSMWELSNSMSAIRKNNLIRVFKKKGKLFVFMEPNSTTIFFLLFKWQILSRHRCS